MSKKLTKANSRKASKTGIKLADVAKNQATNPVKVSKQPSKPPKSAPSLTARFATSNDAPSTFPDRSRAIPQIAEPVIPPSVRRTIAAVKQIKMTPTVKSITPILTLHRTESAHVIRVFDLSDQEMAINVARNIKSGTLIVLTPNDTKIFELGDEPAQRESQPSLPRRKQAPSRPIEDDEEEESGEDVEGEGGDEVGGDEDEFADDPMTQAIKLAEANESDAPTNPSNVRRREPRGDNTPNSICGRCDGGGKTMAGGMCPVCQGRGEIRTYGNRPQSRR